MVLAQGTLQKRGQKDHKGWRIRVFTVKLYLLVSSESTFIEFHQHKYLSMN